MDCVEIFDDYYPAMAKIKKCIPTCPEPEYFRWTLKIIDHHLIVLMKEFNAGNLEYDSDIKVLTYKGNPNWIIQTDHIAPFVWGDGSIMVAYKSMFDCQQIARDCSKVQYDRSDTASIVINRDVFVDKSMNKITHFEVGQVFGTAYIRFTMGFDKSQHIPVCIPTVELFIVR